MLARKHISIDFLNSCNKYEFNNENLKILLYKKNIVNEQVKNKKKIVKKEEKIKNIFIPEEEDSLFWCYVILKYGYSEYELKREKKYESQSELKINLVYSLRNNKELLKQMKLRKTKLEENLVSDKKINLDVFLFLIRLNKFNIVYMDDNIYYEENNNDEEKKYIIKYNKHQDNYGILEISDKELMEEKENKLIVLNISKPIKALSSYKVVELKEICKRLKINIMKTTTKCKTKKELYQLIQEKIN